MTIKDQLKTIREEKGLSRKDVAEKAGIPYTTYVKYETGEREPVLSSLIKLADFYQISLDYLVGRAPQTNPFAMLDLQVDIGEEAVMGQYMQLPKEWRRILLEVMKQLGDAAERGERGGRIKKQPNPYLIKLHQNKASAGFGYDLSSEDEWDEIEIAATPQAIAADFAVEIDGDSMEPDFHDGDIALVRFDPDVPIGKVGLFVLDGMGYIKERGKKCLISRNPAYEDLKLDDSARCIGLVIGIAETV